MRFLREIQGLDEEHLRKKVSSKIKRLEAQSLKENPDYQVLGYQVEDIPQLYQLERTGNESYISLTMRCFYNNFIPKNTKIVFGLVYNRLGRAGSFGKSYYLDDQEYLYDFCKYIQEIDIEDEVELFGYIRDFLKKYFGYFQVLDRDQMLTMLMDINGNPFPINNTHSIKNFKGKGNALCSEYAVMAQNILRLFGFESYLVLGTEKVNDNNPEGHAYNLITYKDSETKTTRHAVLDFMNPVSVYDHDYHKIGEEPFIGYIDKLDEEVVNELIHGDKHLVFDDYGYCIFGNSLLKLGFNRTRNYYVDTYIHPDTKKSDNKVYTLTK